MANHPFWTISGETYSLTIDLGPSSEDRALQALAAFWEHPALTGPYEFLDCEPMDQPVWTGAPRQFNRAFWGVLRIGGHAAVPCGANLLRCKEGADHLDVWLPTESLSRIYPAILDPDAPFDYRPEIDSVLVSIARHVFERVPFVRGAIGWEDMSLSRPSPTQGDLVEEKGVLIWRPPRRGYP